MVNRDTDPRLAGEYVRTVAGSAGTVTLVGVVHDHPASKYRVMKLVSERDPEILALELPPLAQPLFEQYARGERTPPVFGGEMSTAIHAAATDDVVCIDGPSVGFFGRLLRTLSRRKTSFETSRRVLSGVLSATKQALRWRAAGVLAARTGVRLEVDSPVTYDTDWNDSPERQARDEQTHLDRAQSILDVFEPSREIDIRETTREAHMADKLERLSSDADVVAIVGLDHLDAIATRLETKSE